MASRLAIAALLLATSACSYDLDPCSSKPTFSKSMCGNGKVVACWSLDKTIKWACWSELWAPAWSLIGGPAAANAECLAHRTPVGSLSPFYDGACTLTMPSITPQLPLKQQIPWEEARAYARETLKKMNLTEKRMLMYGTGWHPGGGFFELSNWSYVGNTAAIPRLGIPSLNMQDSSGGFRPYWTKLVGTLTAWPSLLCLASTWDPASVRAMARALGKEFRGKGANAVLGPGVNVNRVARNGRNFEYLSGEDPYLGAKLAVAYIEGAQSQGIMAVVKHWVFNEQEDNRATASSNVDPKTAHELYYPPFKASIEAGVDAVMCSYNSVNGEPSCANKEQIGILRQNWAFQGFIQTDWWASIKTDVGPKLIEGVDQLMPGTDPMKTKVQNNEEPQLVDKAVENILGAMYRADLMTTSVCAPPDCEPYLMKNVTSREHIVLARTLATESIVMLRNEDEILPLQPKPPAEAAMKIAVLGAAAVAKPYDADGDGQGLTNGWRVGDLYSGGGSGHIAAHPDQLVNTLTGIQNRAAIDGATVIASPSNDVTQGLAAAAQADVVIIVVGTWAGEFFDRKNLSLDDGADDFITAISSKYPNTIVLLQIPGAILMPWRDSVQAILCLFLGGQETGNAWASVLFGDHAPTGRLPIMMPMTEMDAVLPDESEDLQVDYTEGLATSYRSSFRATYPFGHGLTYTNFDYLPPDVAQCHGDDWCVTLTIRNSGERACRSVAQLYLQLEDSAGHPAPFLKGFQRTPMLDPEQVTQVTFHLTNDDMSYYDAGSSSWVRSSWGKAFIGESSTDIRQEIEVGEPTFQGSWWPYAALLIAILVIGAIGGAFYFKTSRRKKKYSQQDDNASSSGEESSHL